MGKRLPLALAARQNRAFNPRGELHRLVFVENLFLFAVTTAFAFITLPVEYDASNRALAWLKGSNMVLPNEYDGAKDSLKWAARTYVVAAIGSLAQLLYFVMMAMGGRKSE